MPRDATPGDVRASNNLESGAVLGRRLLLRFLVKNGSARVYNEARKGRGGVRKVVSRGYRCRRAQLRVVITPLRRYSGVNIKTNEATRTTVHAAFPSRSAMCLYIDSIPCHREIRINRESSVARASAARRRRD